MQWIFGTGHHSVFLDPQTTRNKWQANAINLPWLGMLYTIHSDSKWWWLGDGFLELSHDYPMTIPWLSHDYPTIIPLCPQIPISLYYTIIYHYSHYSHYYPIKASHYDPTIFPILPIHGHTTSPFHTSLRYASWPLHWLPSWGWCIASRCGSDGPWVNLADDWMMILYIYIYIYGSYLYTYIYIYLFI